MIDERYNQFEYILGDSICMYDGFMKKNVIKTLKFGDKVYVPRFKNENAKFLTNFWLFHKDPKTLWYYLSLLTDKSRDFKFYSLYRPVYGRLVYSFKSDPSLNQV